MKRPIIAYLGIALLTVVAFARATRNDFVRYDDPLYILDNPHVNTGLTWVNVRWAFVGAHVANWHPLTWLSHMLACQLFGVNPASHHAINIALHVVSALLLLHFLSKTTGRLGASFAATALWAVHPMRVESVAWVAEEKDVLSVMLGMACLVAYVRYVRRPGVARYLFVATLYVLSLLAKQTLVTLPFLLLLLDWWPIARVGISWPKRIAEKLPLLGLAIAASLAVLAAQQAGAAVLKIPANVRLENVTLNVVRYLSKTFFPASLALFYPPETKPLWQLVLCGALILAISAVAIRWRRTHPHLFVGWFWFLGTLVPLVGFIQIGFQSIANRYTYWPSIGLTIAVVWEAAAILDRTKLSERVTSRIAAVSAGAITAALIIVTIVQIGYWQDTISIFSHDIDVTNNNFVAHAFLGNELAKLGQDEDAAGHDLESLHIFPNSAQVHNQLAALLLKHGNLAGAIAQYQASLKILPGQFEAEEGLGIALSNSGDAAEAEKHLRAATSLQPQNAQAHFNLGITLQNLHQRDEAVREFQIVLQLDPTNDAARQQLGR